VDIPVVERLVQIGGGGFKSDLLALGVPGECAFREVDHDILLSYLPGTMERVPMGLRVVRMHSLRQWRTRRARREASLRGG
jgi:hypothetical protein